MTETDSNLDFEYNNDSYQQFHGNGELLIYTFLVRAVWHLEYVFLNVHMKLFYVKAWLV